MVYIYYCISWYYIYYLKAGNKNLNVLIYASLNSLYSVIVTIVFMSYPNIILPSFIDYIADYFSLNVVDVTKWFEYVYTIIIVIAVLSFIIEQLVTWIKYGLRKQKK